LDYSNFVVGTEAGGKQILESSIHSHTGVGGVAVAMMAHDCVHTNTAVRLKGFTL
jgi:hypothetical protein